MNRSWQYTLILLLAVVLTVVPAAHAHGTNITYSANGNQIDLVALFDSGEPMADAQIVIYAPDNPSQAYLSGTADGDGHFAFELDTSIAGSWAVSVRTGGHGEIINIPVSNSGQIGEAGSSGGLSPAMRGGLAVGVIALLGGVAYFYTRNSKEEADAHR